MNHSGNEASPASLVTRAQASPVVAVKEFVEPEEVLPVFIEIQHIVTGVDASSAIIGSRKQMLQTVLNLFRHLTEMHVVTASRRALNLELGSVEEIEALERFYQEEVDTQPDGTSPVTVATKEATVRVAGNVADLEHLAIDVHGKGMVLVELGQGADSVVAKEFIFVQHTLQDLFQTILADYGEQNSVALSSLFDARHVSLGDV